MCWENGLSRAVQVESRASAGRGINPKEALFSCMTGVVRVWPLPSDIGGVHWENLSASCDLYLMTLAILHFPGQHQRGRGGSVPGGEYPGEREGTSLRGEYWGPGPTGPGHGGGWKQVWMLLAVTSWRSYWVKDCGPVPAMEGGVSRAWSGTVSEMFPSLCSDDGVLSWFQRLHYISQTQLGCILYYK